MISKHQKELDKPQSNIKLNLFPRSVYKHSGDSDPLKFYYFPILAHYYRKRVEMCLAECTGGQAILEIGFGAGLAFLNLSTLYQKIYGIELSAPISEITQQFTILGLNTTLFFGNAFNLPFPDSIFDTVLLISILEHIQPNKLNKAFSEIYRVLKPKGQVVYGVPVERQLMVFLFRLLGYNIRDYHFSTQKDVATAATLVFGEGLIKYLNGISPFFGAIYQIGNFTKR